MEISVRVDGKDLMENQSVQVYEPQITTLNLDVTTMMAFVSSMTCESCNFSFSQPILDEQARRERLVPTKKILDEIFKGMLKAP